VSRSWFPVRPSSDLDLFIPPLLVDGHEFAVRRLSCKQIGKYTEGKCIQAQPHKLGRGCLLCDVVMQQRLGGVEDIDEESEDIEDDNDDYKGEDNEYEHENKEDEDEDEKDEEQDKEGEDEDEDDSGHWHYEEGVDDNEKDNDYVDEKINSDEVILNKESDSNSDDN